MHICCTAPSRRLNICPCMCQGRLVTVTGGHSTSWDPADEGQAVVHCQEGAGAERGYMMRLHRIVQTTLRI